MVVEELLEFLVRVVDAKLLEAVDLSTKKLHVRCQHESKEWQKDTLPS